MRQLITLPTQSQAQTFADHLLSFRIVTRIEADSAGWAVWVRDEDQMEQARQELELFLREPEHPRYQSAGQAAREVVEEKAAAERRFARNFIDARSLWNPPAPGQTIVTIGLIVVSVVLTLLTEFGKITNPVFQRLSFPAVILVQDDPPLGYYEVLAPLERGELWRPFTPIFIHLGPLHLIFDMFWLYNLGGRMEAYRGVTRFVLLVVVSAVLANVLQFLLSGPGFGMSGVVYALFGYVWMKSRYDPSPGMFISSQNVAIMLIWLVLCMTGLFGNIGNVAHVTGLVVGMVAGLAAPMTRRLFRRAGIRLRR